MADAGPRPVVAGPGSEEAPASEVEEEVTRVRVQLAGKARGPGRPEMVSRWWTPAAWAGVCAPDAAGQTTASAPSLGTRQAV